MITCRLTVPLISVRADLHVGQVRVADRWFPCPCALADLDRRIGFLAVPLLDQGDQFAVADFRGRFRPQDADQGQR